MRIDLDSPGVQEKLKLLPEREKERIKKLLIDLKEISREQTTYSEKLPALEKMAMNERPEVCSITIKKYLVPQVVIRIGKETKIELERRSGGVYRYVRDSGIEVKNS